MKILILFFAFLLSLDLYAQEKKAALVVGNASYPKSPLHNPINDADDVSLKLKTLGFEVITAKDCSTKRDMRKKLDEFCSMASNADAGVFYYSGHGMQLTREDGNYLIPINAEMTSEADVPEECISLNYVLNKMNESGINMKIAIIDACRDNPFRTWHRGGSKGLATPGIVPNGTFIAFATSANDVAADGNERNSPFTKAFIDALDGDNLEIGNVFTMVKKTVKENTNGDQRPWTSNDLTEHFYFAHKQKSENNTVESMIVPCPLCTGRGVVQDRKVCNECSGSGDISVERLLTLVTQLQVDNERSKFGKISSPYIGNASVKLNYGDNIPNTNIKSKGITFLAEENISVVSIVDGIVSAVFNISGRYGILIRHDNYISVYTGLDKVNVQKEQTVKSSQTIGYVEKGKEFEFQIRREINVVNPTEWIEQK